MELASIDGEIVPAAEAAIPVRDDGLLRGDGAFEVVRLYGGRPLLLGEHLARLAQSASALLLPYDAAALAAEIERLLSRAQGADAILRIVITRAGRRLALIEPSPAWEQTVRLRTVPCEPTGLLDGVKSLSYAANVLAIRRAREQGAGDALFVDAGGNALEAPTAAFFWVGPDEVLRTPPLERILASITRRLLIEETGARQSPCPPQELARAQEAFLASTTREVLPVHEIDGRPLAQAPGPVTADAARLLRARIERELAGA